MNGSSGQERRDALTVWSKRLLLGPLQDGPWMKWAPWCYHGVICEIIEEMA